MNEQPERLPLQLAVLTASRLLLNTAIRLTYPFLPALARGLGVPLSAMAQLVALRSLAGFVSPLLAPLSERFGRRVVLAGTLAMFALGMSVVILWPAYWPLGITLILAGVTKVVYDPAMQAYLGDVVPYRQRGKALAVTELSWAGALLFGAPLVGLSIERQGWSAPFFWLGLLGIGAAVLLWRVMPPGRVAASRAASLGAVVAVMRRHPVIWGAAAYVMLMMGANELLLIVYGEWMERSFALDLTNLGLATAVIGGAEIIGEFTVGAVVDRLGKRPVIITTGLLTALFYFLIPYTGTGLVQALATLFFVFLAFEITVVGGVPLMTEIVPSARSVVLSMVLAAASLGRMVGALLGPVVWQAAGLAGNTLLAALATLLAVLVLARWVREGEV